MKSSYGSVDEYDSSGQIARSHNVAEFGAGSINRWRFEKRDCCFQGSNVDENGVCYGQLILIFIQIIF